MSILVTGGLGYIGSHTVVELLKAGREVVIIDNLSNSKEVVRERIEQISGKKVQYYNLDLLDKESVEKVFLENKIETVLNFAAMKSVGESVKEPLMYYKNNVVSLVFLLETMKKYEVKNIVFSSSATVYGNTDSMPLLESAPLSATNPYGRTKLIAEEILRDLYKSDDSWNIAILRYFNPIGAHKSGLLGEDPNGVPNNILPYISKVAAGELKELSVFGDDYDTKDGTGVRDYIHVVDLADGHVKALEKLESGCGLITYNLGTGRGYSVLELKNQFEKASSRRIPFRISERRAGDVAKCYADPSKAERELRWKAKNGLKEMCEDAWRWQVNSSK